MTSNDSHDVALIVMGTSPGVPALTLLPRGLVAAAFSPVDPNRLAVLDDTGTIATIDLPGGRPHAVAHAKFSAPTVAWDPSGTGVYFFDDQLRLQRLDLRAGTTMSLAGKPSEVPYSLEVAADGTLLAVAPVPADAVVVLDDYDAMPR